MLLHSEAKVEFFKKYIERYLRILYLAGHIDEINIFDVFCGLGIYENEKKGSPIVAFDTIKNLCLEHDHSKKIQLIVNDGKKSNVMAVENYINENNTNYCSVEYNNLPADEMFRKMISIIGSQGLKTRNLIFLDPYGYKEIKASELRKLLDNHRTEIILFLPISQMQRFTVTAMENESKPYEPLRGFVYSFFFQAIIRSKNKRLLP